MKTIYIPALKKTKLDESRLKELESRLPGCIYIGYSIQYKELAEEIRKKIKKRVIGFSQVLGCSELRTKADAVLLVGSGRFHALNLAFSSGREVFVFPEMIKITKEEIELFSRKENAKTLKFMHAEKFGVIVSSKTGQEHLANALNFKKKMKKKKAYLFLADSISLNELENFPFDIWVNTACPGIALDSGKIINLSSVQKLAESQKY